jgi:hypothetical protein
MTELTRLKFAQFSWMIETYHRGIKQFCGIERCQARSERPNGIISNWLCVLFFALSFMPLTRALAGLKPKLRLFVRLFGLI